MAPLGEVAPIDSARVGRSTRSHLSDIRPYLQNQFAPPAHLSITRCTLRLARETQVEA